jgi:hypothetical protein
LIALCGHFAKQFLASGGRVCHKPAVNKAMAACLAGFCRCAIVRQPLVNQQASRSGVIE